MPNHYTSQFTGDELDFAISSALGSKYRGTLSPGCHLIGASTDQRANFNELTIPGKYTAYFFQGGPRDSESVSPVCIQVFWGATMLYQTIQLGSNLYWRDMLSGDIGHEGEPDYTGYPKWNKVSMGSESTVIVDSLYDDLDSDLSSVDKALSANMGAELRKRIEKQQIGNVNLIDHTNILCEYDTKIEDYWTMSSSDDSISDRSISSLIEETLNDIDPDLYIRDYSVQTSGWLSGMTYYVYDGTNNTYTAVDTSVITEPDPDTAYFVKTNFDSNDYGFPVMDDIDSENVTIYEFGSSANGSCTSIISNKAYVSKGAQYTASVYVILPANFERLTPDSKDSVFINLYKSGDEQSENTIGASFKLYDLFCKSNTQISTEFDSDDSYKTITDGDGNVVITYTVLHRGAYFGYARISYTYTPSISSISEDTEDSSGTKIIFKFGVSNLAEIDDKRLCVRFAYPKVEYGQYATQYNHSWYDLTWYFTNTERIYDVDIDVDSPTEFNDQDGLIFKKGDSVATSKFHHEPVTVGGGGGFVIFDSREGLIPNHGFYAPNVTNANIYNDNDNFHPSGLRWDKCLSENIPIESLKEWNERFDKILVYNTSNFDDASAGNHHINGDTKDRIPLILNHSDYMQLDWSHPENCGGYWKDISHNTLMYFKYDPLSGWNEGHYTPIVRKPMVECKATEVEYYDNKSGLTTISIPNFNDTGIDEDCELEAYTNRDYNFINAASGQAWLDTTERDAEVPATIKYFDTLTKTWRAPKADAGKVWYKSEVPDDGMRNLIWINSNTRAPYIYDSDVAKWVPLLALWGSTNT